ncbi:unnamed protein product [Withania somnifera]
MDMPDSGNILAIEGDKLDRLTDLPINVIHQIQDNISIEDAARMSVLSRTWRYIWASKPKLVFDTQFCTKRPPSNTIDTISTILSQHHGSIKIFFVDISVIHSSQHSVVNQWMQFLSRNGLMNLTIENQNSGGAPYKLPSYVYDVELQRLSLSNCIFRPPCHFRGFHKLRVLLLIRVSFELDIVTSSLWMLNLVNLGFQKCSGVRFLNIYAPKVAYLRLIDCGIDTLNLSPFMNSEKMRFFTIASENEVSLKTQDKAMKLTDLLSSWPNLSYLIYGRCFLKFLPSGTGEESPPMRLTGLRGLYLCDYDFGSKDQTFASGQRKKNDMEVDVYSFQEPDYKTQQLDNLKILKIHRLCGSRDELRFISFILSSAPLLQKAILLVDTSVSESQSLKISEELMRFPRASPEAEIIYELPSKEQTRLLRC